MRGRCDAGLDLTSAAERRRRGGMGQCGNGATAAVGGKVFPSFSLAEPIERLLIGSVFLLVGPIYGPAAAVILVVVFIVACFTPGLFHLRESRLDRPTFQRRGTADEGRAVDAPDSTDGDDGRGGKVTVGRRRSSSATGFHFLSDIASNQLLFSSNNTLAAKWTVGPWRTSPAPGHLSVPSSAVPIKSQPVQHRTRH